MEPVKSSLPSESLNRIWRIAIFDDATSAREFYEKDIFADKPVKLRFFSGPLLPEEDAQHLVGFDPDLLVVDLVMGTGRLDGFDLIRRLRENKSLSQAPIVVCSKLVSPTAKGQEVRNQVLELEGVKAALSKIGPLPTYEDFASFLIPS